MLKSIGNSLGDPLVGVLAGLSILVALYLFWDVLKEKWQNHREKRDRLRRQKEFLEHTPESLDPKLHGPNP